MTKKTAKKPVQRTATITVRVWDGATEDDLNDAIQHAARSIADGYLSGEAYPDTGTGWWEISTDESP